jgi:hypothetical protein
MNRFTRFLGQTCDKCKLCQYARKNPDTLFGRIMAWHGNWCPAWKAQKELERDKQKEE